ncbi:MAG: Zn-dependent hydrolase [Sphingomonadales bacterium]
MVEKMAEDMTRDEKYGLRINRDRLLGRIEDLAAVGRLEAGGCQRIALSDADKAGRDLVSGWMRGAGLEVSVDEIGNIFGMRAGGGLCRDNGDGAPVMTGSHIDTVAEAGKLDGAYGVLAGLEVMETLNDAGLTTKRPLVLAAFTNEEGVRFQPDMMGSLVHAGGLSLEAALESVGEDGTRLGDELKRIHYDGEMKCGTLRPAAFVELHIEQGPVLEASGKVIGAVENLQGISWQKITIEGQANHAGTTPMELRRDAGYLAAGIVTFVRRLTGEVSGRQVATVGSMRFEPDVINVVPSRAELTVDLRNTEEAGLREAEARLEKFIEEAAAAENLHVSSRRLARFGPVEFDRGIVQVIEAAAERLGLATQRMASGAGHDAQMMARIAPAAMIFVPSLGGVSHNPAEETSDHHLEAGANVLLGTMLGLANGTGLS